ncbi:MAG TPA: hypothetical protein VHP11_15975 [Tepidisphaeraceae bacterium]|nr:hypothetical protein [Tepidisphaeraceae bacterium]
MVLGTYPLGISALNPDWPEAHFNVSGAFTLHALILRLFELVDEGFGCRLPIDAMHGAPSMPWNAGRLSKVPYNPAQFRSLLTALRSKGIGYFATFTNHLIDDTDLANPIGNSILEIIAERPDINGVIVSSDRLSKYIARKYPALRQVASIIKTTMEHGEGRADYYRELGQQFHQYAVHPDDCRDPKLLDQLDRQKAVIIVNENCTSHCPNRIRHYDNTARLQRASCRENMVVLNTLSPTSERQLILQELRQIMSTCKAPLDQAGLGSRRRSCNLTNTEMRTAYDMGFRHFKLQGRGGYAYNYIYDITRFTLEPDFAAPMICKTMCSMLPTA